jgi:hypothetical protein
LIEPETIPETTTEAAPAHCRRQSARFPPRTVTQVETQLATVVQTTVVHTTVPVTTTSAVTTTTSTSVNPAAAGAAVATKNNARPVRRRFMSFEPQSPV